MASRRRELPEDLVAEVLCRLPPRSVAVSRCTCRTWRDLIDDRRLLRKDLLPRSVGGVFMNYARHCVSFPEFLVRPTTGPSISSALEFIPADEVTDHCNGLLLLCTHTEGDDHDAADCVVANPATRQWAWLPLPPQQMRKEEGFRQSQCLVYDPTVSPHYHVFLIGSSQLDQHRSSALQVYVYSSETGRWEERWFAPEVPVVETTTINVDHYMQLRVYWRGRLYLLCWIKGHGHIRLILRISTSNASYRLIPTPAGAEDFDPGLFSLGRSEKGIYCAFAYDENRFRIFLLNESCGQIVWELRHSVDLETFADNLLDRKVWGDRPNGPWIIYSCCENDRHKKVVADKFGWNSDDDDVLSTEDMVEGLYTGDTVSLLGFHPYKEVVFLNASLSRAVAYHWNTSKFQDLGNICPKDCLDHAGCSAAMLTSFIYTPCWMEEFPQNSLQAPIED